MSTIEAREASGRLLDRLAPKGNEPLKGNEPEEMLVHNMRAVFDETVAEMIRMDGDGTALRGWGFTAIADAIDKRTQARRR